MNNLLKKNVNKPVSTATTTSHMTLYQLKFKPVYTNSVLVKWLLYMIINGKGTANWL